MEFLLQIRIDFVYIPCPMPQSRCHAAAQCMPAMPGVGRSKTFLRNFKEVLAIWIMLYFAYKMNLVIDSSPFSALLL